MAIDILMFKYIVAAPNSYYKLRLMIIMVSRKPCKCIMLIVLYVDVLNAL